MDANRTLGYIQKQNFYDMEGFFLKLSEAVNSVWGWLIIVAMCVLDYFTGYGVMINITVMAVVMDAVWGICSARKQGRFALSELGRNTLSKLAVYGCCVICFIGIDSLLGLSGGITTSVVCVCIVLVELWSTCASMIICFPKMPFLFILKRALAGEIGRKLGVEPADVEDVLKKIEENEKY